MTSKEAEAVASGDAGSPRIGNSGLNISPHESLIGLRVIATATEKKRSVGHWFVSAPQIEERGSVNTDFFYA